MQEAVQQFFSPSLAVLYVDLVQGHPLHPRTRYRGHFLLPGQRDHESFLLIRLIRRLQVLALPHLLVAPVVPTKYILSNIINYTTCNKHEDGY